MKLVWLTDVHLNFLPEGGAAAFGEHVRSQHPDMDAAVVTGDIGEYPNWEALIEQFAAGAGARTWFVLGNHDAYGGSIAGMKEAAAKMGGLARWLHTAGPVELCEGVALTGHDGWYDARFGDARGSHVLMNDFAYVRELLQSCVSGGDGLLKALQRLGHEAAEEARASLSKAVDAGYTKVLFATHVPPFAQAAWHDGAQSNRDWLPWMSCKAMGVVLREVAQAHPGVQFTVLCGHTHGPGEYLAEPNLRVLTGQADYGRPSVSGTFSFP